MAALLVTKILSSTSAVSMIYGVKPASRERRLCTGSPCILSADKIIPSAPTASMIPPLSPIANALLLGVLDQRARDPVLDRAGRVARLELGPDAHAALGREAWQLDQRGVPDRLHDVPVPTTAGPVPQPLSRHYFREYSALAWGWL